MTHLIQVEGVGGQMLNYLGYVISSLELPDIDQEVQAMFLIVPDIGYNCTTPILIGTNILEHLCSSDLMGFQYPWPSVFQCMHAQVRNLNVAVKTTKSYTVPAESALYIDGMVHAPVFCGRMTVVAEAPASPLGPQALHEFVLNSRTMANRQLQFLQKPLFAISNKPL